MKKFSFRILIFLLISSSYLYSNEFSNLKEKWLNNEISNTTFIKNIQNITPLNPQEQSDYLLYIGKAFLFNNNSDKSIEVLEEVIDISNEIIKRSETSEQYRIISEAGTYLMLQKGIPYIIKKAKDINNYALKALKMDPDNYRAQYIVANGLINSPQFFGGDFKKGVNMLEAIISTTNQNKELLFESFLALSKAYSKKNKEKALDYCIKAKELYPNNKELLKQLDSLKG